MSEKRYREMQLRLSQGNADTFEASISSTTPIRRYFGYEILNHSPGAVDLSRAESGLPLLFSHDPEYPIGIVEGVHIDNGKLRGAFRFGNSTKAQEIKADVEDGILRNVSIGYIVIEDKITGERDGIPEITVTKWELLEASILAIPADQSVGIGRSYESGETTMATENTNQTNQTRSQRRQKHQQGEAEQERVNEINALTTQYEGEVQGLREISAQAIRDKVPLHEFQRTLIRKLGECEPLELTPATETHGLTNSDRRQFSITNAIRALIDPKSIQDASYELEVSRHLANELGKSTDGFLIPLGSMSNRTMTAAVQGAHVIQETILEADFIDILRARSAILQKPVMHLEGLKGNVLIPKKTGSATAGWLDPDGTDSVTTSDVTLGSISLSPKTVGALVIVSRKIMKQSSVDLEAMLRLDMADSLATEVDNKAFAGDGTSNTPVGIANTTGVNAVAFAASGNPTFSELVSMETAILEDKVLPGGFGSMSYVMAPAIAGTLKTTTKDAGSGEFLWSATADGTMGLVNNLAAESSLNITANNVLLGAWEHFIAANWGVIEIDVDPYHDFARGTIAVRAFLDMDFGLRHTGAFCVGS